MKLCSAESLVKKAIKEVNLNLAIFKDNELIYSSSDPGITPIYNFVKENFHRIDTLTNLYIGDKIVGKAGTLLMVLLKPKFVYAQILSKSGKEILERYKINFECDTETEYIINRDRTGLCPFEKAVLNIEDPINAVDKIEETLSNLRKK